MYSLGTRIPEANSLIEGRSLSSEAYVWFVVGSTAVASLNMKISCVLTLLILPLRLFKKLISGDEM